MSRSVGQSPFGRAAVDEVAEARVVDGADEVLGRDVVLVDDDQDLVRMRHEERVDVAQHRAQRCRADLAERVAQVHPARALAAEAEPLADAQRRVDRLGADAVLRGLSALVLGAAEVRAQAAVAQAVGVVGVDQQASDAVLELARDRPVLLGGEPARQRDRHRVVRGDEGDPVERAVAELDVAVAGVRPRRRGRRAARAEEGGDDRDHEPTGCDGAQPATSAGGGPGRRPRGVGRRRAVRRSRGRAIDEPQQRVRAGVDQEDAEEGHRERDDRVAREERDHPGGDEGDRTQGASRRRRLLGGDVVGEAAQALADGHRPQERRRGGSDDRAAGRQDPRGGPQVAEEGVPDRAGRGARVGAVDLPDRDRTRDAEQHHDGDPGGGGPDPELGDGAAAVGRRPQRGSRKGEAEERHDDREDAERPRGVRDRRAEAPPVPFEDLDAVGRPHLPRDRRLELLERDREHGADIGDRQGDRVLVAVEDGAVDVADSGAEEPGNALPPTIPDTAASISGRAARRSAWRFRTTSSVTRSAMTVRTLSSRSAAAARLANWSESTIVRRA